MIAISLAYVSATGATFYQEMSVSVGTSIRAALMLSGWLTGNHHGAFDELNAWLMTTDDQTQPNHKHWYVGVFAQKQPLGYVLTEGDRVEIYRPLALDPMKRRQNKVKIPSK
ncbi:MAG: RnfH family protein [Moraxella sp.]|nr:RnfH family protein [Moraxella sp.]